MPTSKPVTPPETRDKLIERAQKRLGDPIGSHMAARYQLDEWTFTTDELATVMADFHLSQQSEEAELLREIADTGFQLAAYRSRGGKS